MQFSPITISLRSPAASLTATISPGQSIRAVVSATTQGLVVSIANTRIPLPESSGLHAGETVRVRLLDTGNGARIEITPATTQAQANVAQSTHTSVALLETLAAKLAPEIAQPSVFATVLPKGLPLTESSVRLLLMLFTLQGASGRGLALIGTVLEEALAAGVALPAWAAGLKEMITKLASPEREAMEEAIRRIVQLTRNSPEARLAGGMEIDERATGDLRTQLALLKQNDALLEFLIRSGQHQSFEKALDATLERLVGGQLQNLHSPESNYFFLELPFPPDAIISHAQLHFFGEGNGDSTQSNLESSTLVMDLTTSQLGDLWITLRTTSGECDCQIRATSPEAHALLSQDTTTLETALTAAGYDPVRVSIGEWNGDRVAELAGIMRRFSGLDLNA